MKKYDKVVALILNYNSAEDSKKCISFLKKQNYENLLITVIDNCSCREDKKKIRTICNYEKVKLLENDKNQGFSAGNNIGIKYAKKIDAKWVLIINPDVELRDKNYITDVIEAKHKYEKAKVIATNIILPNGDRQNPMRIRTFAEEFFWPIEIIKHHTKFWDHYLQENKSGYCDMVHGSCFFLNVDFIDKIGYLDENVFLYCEEEILASNVKKYGGKILYLKDFTAYHEHYSSNKGRRDQRMRIYFKSRYYYYKNYCDYSKIKLILLKFSLWSWSIYWKLKNQ